MENEFWVFLDQLVRASEVVIDRPMGSVHPRYPDEEYPLDYGYLKDTGLGDDGGLDVWIGSNSHKNIQGIICTIDQVKKDVEVKVLFGCSDTEMQTILEFQNSGSMRAMLVRK